MQLIKNCIFFNTEIYCELQRTVCVFIIRCIHESKHNFTGLLLFQLVYNKFIRGNIIMKQQVFNPYLPSWEYVPDGEPHVFGDRLYIFGSHDRFNGAVFTV